MPKFKLIISNQEEGESKSVEIEGSRAQSLIGLRIGEVLDGSMVGFSGYKFQITGGSDGDGTPMRPDVHGGVAVSVLITRGVGFRSKRRGERRRKRVRGNTITEAIEQINTKIIDKPRKKRLVKPDKI
jgi:small subunit ribosomal protein S6e